MAKILVAAGVATQVLCASASAKFGISIATGDSTPALGQPITVVVRSERELDYDLRLIAVAPGKNIFRVVATITGDTSRPDPNIARNGFEVQLVRVAPARWRGFVRFRSPDVGASSFRTAHPSVSSCPPASRGPSSPFTKGRDRAVARRCWHPAAGRLAQPVEHLLYTQGVGGSIPSPPMLWRRFRILRMQNPERAKIPEGAAFGGPALLTKGVDAYTRRDAAT